MINLTTNRACQKGTNEDTKFQTKRMNLLMSSSMEIISGAEVQNAALIMTAMILQELKLVPTISDTVHKNTKPKKKTINSKMEGILPSKRQVTDWIRKKNLYSVACAKFVVAWKRIER